MSESGSQEKLADALQTATAASSLKSEDEPLVTEEQSPESTVPPETTELAEPNTGNGEEKKLEPKSTEMVAMASPRSASVKHLPECPKAQAKLNYRGQSIKLHLFTWELFPTRTFHILWFTWWLCFFGWFGTANLSIYIDQSIDLSNSDKAIAGGCAVASTIVFRMLIGSWCESHGPRLVFTVLLGVSCIPLACVGLIQTHIDYIVIHFFLGIIGAGFVVTQYHCTHLFDPGCIGVVSATVAGWGNFGGGCANLFMPLLCRLIAWAFGIPTKLAWRFSFLVPAFLLFLMATFYYVFSFDTPEGDFREMRLTGVMPSHSDDQEPKMKVAFANYRTRILCLAYGCSFGVELTVLRFASDYFEHHWSMNPTTPGLLLFAFGSFNVFARPLGGYMSDYFVKKYGSLQYRVYWLSFSVFVEGIMLMLFSIGGFSLAYSIFILLCLAFWIQQVNGACFAVVPFVEPKCIGSVAGIVGAGGNTVAVCIAFGLFTMVPQSVNFSIAWFILGVAVFCGSFVMLLIRFDDATKKEEDSDAELGVSDMPVGVASASSIAAK